jgi:hypothetical protein
LTDLDVCGPLCGRNQLAAGPIGDKQAADASRNRPYENLLFHVHTSREVIQELYLKIRRDAQTAKAVAYTDPRFLTP